MAPENPWFLITQSEILAIQKRLRYLETGLPETGPEHIGEIHSILSGVQDRKP
jgi:hypothetical protein